MFLCTLAKTSKRHKINDTILSQKKTGGFTASASFRLRFRFDRLRDTDREAPTCHVYAKLLQATAYLLRCGLHVPDDLHFSRLRSSRERSAELRKAIVTDVSELHVHVDQHDKH